MDDQQLRIQEDLSGILKGEIRCDALTLAMYSNDASLYEVKPIGVAWPLDENDVVTLAQYATLNNIPLVPRGAGTGLAGGALGAGIVVDFSKHMNKILEIGSDYVVVQPGVVLDVLNEKLKPTGRYFPPDPSNSAVTTIGGMLGVDAAGSHAIRVGSTRDYVMSVDVVLANGDWMTAGIENVKQIQNTTKTISPPLVDSPVTDGSRNPKQPILSRLKKLLKDHKNLIEEKQPAMIRNCAGYYLRSLLSNDQLNLPRLLVGSEGTLGFSTSIKLHTVDLPEHTGVALLLFDNLKKAVEAVQLISEGQPSACDLLDRRVLSLAKQANSKFASLIPDRAEAAILFEQVGFTDVQMRRRISEMILKLRESDCQATVATVAYTKEEIELLWSLPRTVVPHLSQLKGSTRPIPFIEDIAIPPENLNDFFVQSQKVFQRHQVTASLYAHAATGQLHLRPFMENPKLDEGKTIEAVARDLYQAVFDHHGTISGEHGDGLSRTSFLRSQYGLLYTVFKEVKNIFDPQNLLNPGKIVSDDPHITRKHLRPMPMEEEVALQLSWQEESASSEALACNGCGACKTQKDNSRMCPFFRVQPSEEASPRAKANLMRHLTSGSLAEEELASEEFKELSNLCFNCKQCEIECPTQVNIPQLMIEAKAANVAANGIKRSDWILSRAHSFGRLGTRLSFIMNPTLSSRPARWLFEKVFGIAKERKLPRFASRSFIGSAKSQLTNRDRAFDHFPNSKHKPVIYFVDHYSNYHDTDLAKAMIAILHHHEIPVFIPQEQTASGMAMISAGEIDSARVMAEQNLRELGEFAREGHDIICSDASAAICLKKEYPKIINHPDVEVVSKQTIEAGALLKRLLESGKLKTDFKAVPISIGHHLPCHIRAMYHESPYTAILKKIPELKLNSIDKGCSGMAGAFGISRENFETSIQIGEELMQEVDQGPYDIGVSECSSCKMQMEQGTSRPTLHPIKIIAQAYGLIDNWDDLITIKPKRKTVS